MPGLESLFWRGIRLQRRRGEEKNCLGPEKFFRGLGARNKAAQARQAKTSQGQPPRSDDLQWVWLVSGWSCRHQPWWLGPHHVCPRHGVPPYIIFLVGNSCYNQCLVFWYPVKGNKNQWLEFQGNLGFLFQLADSRVESSNPASEVLIAGRFLNNGLTVPKILPRHRHRHSCTYMFYAGPFREIRSDQHFARANLCTEFSATPCAVLRGSCRQQCRWFRRISI